MSQRSFGSKQRGVVLAFAFACFLFLSYFSVRNALAAHCVALQTRLGYERATRLEPGDFRNWLLLGRYWQYSLEETDTARAIQVYNVALSLNPRSADLWSDLGTAYEAEGNVAAARDAFLHAKSAYPLSAEISWGYANFLLRQGELDAAFLEMRNAVQADPKRGAEALSRALSAEPNIDLVIDRVLPPASEAYTGAIFDQVSEGHTASAVVIWNRLAALHPKKLPLEIYTYYLVGALLREKLVGEAQRIWKQAADFAGYGNPSGPADSLLWDGGFESGVFGTGFAWAPPGGAQVQISFDTREKHSGNRSLRLLFNGRSNLGLNGPCAEVAVQPSTAYQFSAWVRTQSITTEQGIRFQLRPIGTQDNATVVTSDLRGNEPWTEIEATWASGKDTQEMQVCVARLPSQEFDDKIQGIAWVDDVALVPVSAEPRKP
ncbi:MAG TPA: tetratricopeptide repeat protein [Candidatus Acidoferrum sp.]|nr:tetratricopeptide repeat protein [Candidatus Acidoferrum sp.]